MKPIVRCTLIPLALTAATSAAAEQQSSTPAKAGAGGSAERMICKTRQMTGSRLSVKRICMTRQQWSDASREDQKALQDHLSSGAQISTTR